MHLRTVGEFNSHMHVAYHMISERGIEVDLDKIRVSLDMSPSRNETEIRGFLGSL